MNRLSFFSVIIWMFAWCASFAFLPAFSSVLVGAAIVLLLSASMLAFYDVMKRKTIILPKNTCLIVLGLFWLVALGSVVWSQIQWTSYTQFWVLSCLPISTLFFLDIDRQNLAIKILLFGFGCLACLAFFQYYVLQDMLFQGRVKWPLNNPNSLGAVFSLGAFLALGHGLKHHSKLAFSVFGLAVIGVLLTGSRGALGAGIVALIIGLWLMRDSVSIKKTHIFISVALFLVVASILMMTGVRPDNMALTTIPKTILGDHSLLWSRADIWAGTWEIIKVHPWLGAGVGTFPHFYAQHQALTEGSAGIVAHNDPLQFWAEMGIASFILFYVFCALFTMQTMKALRATKDKIVRLSIIIPFCALGAMIAHSHVSFNLHNIPILFLSGLLIAQWMVAVESAKGTKPYVYPLPYLEKRGAPYRAYYVLNIWVLLVILVAVPFVSNYYAQNALRYSRLNNIERLVDHINKAKVWSFGLSPQPYIQATPIQISMLEHDIDILMRTDKAKRIKEIESMISTIERLNPRSVAVSYNRALLARTLSDNDPAYGDIDKYLKQALVYKPRHIQTRLWLVDRYEEREEYVEALEIMEAVLPWCTRTLDVLLCYSKLSQLYALNGKIDKSLEMIKATRDRTAQK